MATKIWVVRFDDRNDEDRATISSYKKYEASLAQAVQTAGIILKDDSEAVEWDEEDLEKYEDFKKAVSEKNLEEAFAIWEELSSDLDFAENVTIEESTLS